MVKVLSTSVSFEAMRGNKSAAIQAIADVPLAETLSLLTWRNVLRCQDAVISDGPPNLRKRNASSEGRERFPLIGNCF